MPAPARALTVSVEEVTVEGEGLVGAVEVRAATWIAIEEGQPDPTLLSVLNRGETAAIPLAEPESRTPSIEIRSTE
jgi:hypothetical protein